MEYNLLLNTTRFEYADKWYVVIAQPNILGSWILSVHLLLSTVPKDKTGLFTDCVLGKLNQEDIESCIERFIKLKLL